MSSSCGREHVRERPVKNSAAGIVRSPSGPVRDELRVEREHDRAEVGSRIGVGDGAADRASVANLRVADELGRLRDQAQRARQHRVADERRRAA